MAGLLSGGILLMKAIYLSLLFLFLPAMLAAGFLVRSKTQLTKFNQSLGTVSDDVVNQATGYLRGCCRKIAIRRTGTSKRLGVKAGIATYHRKMKTPVGTVKLPNNHQPYIGLRVTKPLPPKGAQCQHKATQKAIWTAIRGIISRLPQSLAWHSMLSMMEINNQMEDCS